MIVVPGMEAAHVWTAADGTEYVFPGVTAEALATYPRAEIRAIDGRHDRAEAEDRKDKANSRIGEIPRDASLLGKTEAWQILVKARTGRELRQALATLSGAFGENEVGEMTIRLPRSYGGPIRDEFTLDSLGDYTIDQGAGTLVVFGGALVPSSTALKRLRHNGTVESPDVRAEIEYRTGSSVSGSEIGVSAKHLDGANYLFALRFGTQLDIWKRDGGANSPLSGASITGLPAHTTNTPYLLRLEVDGNVVTASHYGYDSAGSLVLVGTVSHTLTGANATKFGAGVVGGGGIGYWVPGHISARIESFEVGPLRAGRLTFRARVLSYSAPDRQEYRPDQVEARGTGGWMRKATLGLRLHDPRYYDERERSSTLSAPSAPVGLTVPFTVPFTIQAPLDSFGPHTITRDGNAPADPVIELWGPWNDPVVYDVDRLCQLAFPGLALSSGQYLTIDFAERTAILSTGASARDYIDWAVSDWWDRSVKGLPKGVVSLAYAGRSIGTPAKAVVRWKDASY